ncbi:hypothetical protein CN354_22180 [Bacillus cereus]|nr:hypothetical protein CN354_22180 [Bacillus cereus]
MSKKVFTEKEMKRLSFNQYVKSVSSKSITYTDEFKRIFMAYGNHSLLLEPLKKNRLNKPTF